MCSLYPSQKGYSSSQPMETWWDQASDKNIRIKTGNINLAQSHTKKQTVGSKLGQAPLFAPQKMGKILFDCACPYEGVFQDDSGHGKEQLEI